MEEAVRKEGLFCFWTFCLKRADHGGKTRFVTWSVLNLFSSFCFQDPGFQYFFL